MTFFNSENTTFTQQSGNNNTPQLNVIPLTGDLLNPFYLQNVCFTANSATIAIRIGVSTSSSGTNPIYFYSGTGTTSLSANAVSINRPIYIDSSIQSIVFETTLATASSASISFSYLKYTNSNSSIIKGNLSLAAGSNTGTIFTSSNPATYIKSIYLSIPALVGTSPQNFILTLNKGVIGVNISTFDMGNSINYRSISEEGIILNQGDSLVYSTDSLTSTTTLSCVISASDVS